MELNELAQLLEDRLQRDERYFLWRKPEMKAALACVLRTREDDVRMREALGDMTERCCQAEGEVDRLQKVLHNEQSQAEVDVKRLTEEIHRQRNEANRRILTLEREVHRLKALLSPNPSATGEGLTSGYVQAVEE